MVRDADDPSIEIDEETCRCCTGLSAVRKSDGTLMTSKEWCREVNTCAASIDWDRVLG